MVAAHVAILSDDPDFSETLAEHIKKELGFGCGIYKKADDLQIDGSVSWLIVAAPGMEINDAYTSVVRIKKKPLKLQELLDEIALMMQKRAIDAIALGGGYHVQVRQKHLCQGSDKFVTLTDKELQLLQCLNEAGGKAVLKEQLLKQIWGIDSPLDTHTLETHIYRLRSKFRELAGNEGDDSVIAARDGGYALDIK